MNPVLVSNAMKPTEIERIIDITDATVIVSDHKQDWSIPCINKNTVMHCNSKPLKTFYHYHPDEMCLWLLSSGSTGEPKCIVNRHANLYKLFELVVEAAGINSNSVIFSTAKMSWTYGFNVTVNFALGMGATAHVSAGLPAPSRIYKRLENYAITHLFTVPSVLASMIKHPNPIIKSNFKLFTAGEPLPNNIAQWFLAEYEQKIYEVFGMSETTSTYCLQTESNWQLGTVGQPLPGTVYKICDEYGQPVELGQIGELFISSPCQSSFYWKDWKKTQDVFQGSWVKTGDKFFQNPQGNLVFLGRTDDLIKIKGLYVAPVEIENTIMNLPGVEDCTVVHAPNSVGLAELHAFVISDTVFDLQYLQQQLKNCLPDHKIPRHIKFVDSLPKTVTNKKMRGVLRKSLLC
jgi:benzoate-CoA ligase